MRSKQSGADKKEISARRRGVDESAGCALEQAGGGLLLPTYN